VLGLAFERLTRDLPNAAFFDLYARCSIIHESLQPAPKAET
jgi:hypothetical protein